MPQPQQPSNPYQKWEACEKLVNDSTLFRVLRVRLLQIAMTEAAAGVRAIEMLLGLGQESVDADLADVPTERLELLRDKAAQYLQQQNGDSEL